MGRAALPHEAWQVKPAVRPKSHTEVSGHELDSSSSVSHLTGKAAGSPETLNTLSKFAWFGRYRAGIRTEFFWFYPDYFALDQTWVSEHMTSLIQQKVALLLWKVV